MHALSPAPRFRTFSRELLRPVRMVMIYEDAEAGRRAQQFADAVLRGADGDYVGAACFWDFDALESFAVRHAAASAAAKAEFVVFAASGEREIPADVDEWMGVWAWMIGGRNPALIALLNELHGDNVRSIRRELGVIAERKNLEFVAFHLPADRPEEGSD